jgi:hypothetical protein
MFKYVGIVDSFQLMQTKNVRRKMWIAKVNLMPNKNVQSKQNMFFRFKKLTAQGKEHVHKDSYRLDAKLV